MTERNEQNRERWGRQMDSEGLVLGWNLIPNYLKASPLAWGWPGIRKRQEREVRGQNYAHTDDTIGARHAGCIARLLDVLGRV